MFAGATLPFGKYTLVLLLFCGEIAVGAEETPTNWFAGMAKAVADVTEDNQGG